LQRSDLLPDFALARRGQAVNGEAVNIAARVQALSGADEIYLTGEMLSIPEAEELRAAFATEGRSVQLRGVQGHIRVHRVHPGSGRTVEPVTGREGP
jgi:class 3 adenylate cyclase